MRPIDADNFEVRLIETFRVLKLPALEDVRTLYTLWTTVMTVLSSEPTLQECRWPEGVTVKPDGVHEADAHEWVEEEIVENATVHVLRCKTCGVVSLGWTRG